MLHSARARKIKRKLMSCKVDFVIVGTQKGGTTALDACLREHPGVRMANQKEVHFFDNEKHFPPDGNVDYNIYHEYFSPSPSGVLLGEATPIYMYWTESPKRIHAYNPAIKIIVMLRNPIYRAFSHWNMERDRGADSLSFWEAITTETQRCQQAHPYQHRVFSYIDRGFYSRQLERLWSYFPKEQTLILRQEEFKETPLPVFNKVCDFLGVERFVELHKRDVHSRPYSTSMSPREWDYLNDIFGSEITRLEALLGWDCSSWRRRT